MRNLKKILALVLALVLSLSLVTIASGADFNDADEIELTEAVDVMSAIGVLEGHNTGDFAPKGTLTREQAAKIITYMLLGESAERLSVGSTSFSDVAADRWSAADIEYCTTLGIIAGNGDGTFGPANTLTGYAFAKMLLTALGYKADAEGLTGTGWTVNVSRLALQIGLDDGIEGITWSDPLTREQAAQMALNAVKTPLVQYNDGVTVVVNGTPVTVGSGSAYYVTTTLAKEQRIGKDTLSNSNEYTVEFGERYFPNLRLNSEADEFERPSHTWVYNGEEIGSYTDYDLRVASYTASITGRDLYDLLGASTIKDYSLAYYVDGAESSVVKASNMIRTNTRSYSTTGTGVLTEVFVDHTNEDITITSVNTYLAVADADYNETRGELSLTVYDKDKNGDMVELAKTVDVEDIASVTEYAEGDFMLVNLAAIGSGSDPYEVVRINDVDSMVDCTVTGYSKGSTVTVDGQDIDYAAKASYKEGVLDEYNQGYLGDYTYTFYLDQYGNVIGAEIYEGEANYLFLTGYDLNGSNLSVNTAEAAAIFLDGSMKKIDVDVQDTNDNIELYNDDTTDTDREYAILADNKNGGESEYNHWFRYTMDANNVYTLTPAENWVNEATGSEGDEVNSAAIRVGAGSYRAYGNDESIYITVDTGDVDKTTKTGITGVNGLYTGVQEVDLRVLAPSANGLAGAESIFALYDDDHYIIGAVIIGEDINNTHNYAYILDTEAQREWREDGTDFWRVQAVVDGEIVDLVIEDYDNTITAIQKVLNNSKYKRGAMYRVTYNAAGNVIKAELCVDTGLANDYVYGNNDYTARDIEPDDDAVYNVLNVSDKKLNLQGRALYIGDQDDYGLFLASGAAIIVVQDEIDTEGGTEVTAERYTNASAALNALANKDSFSGSISAVLNDAGNAEYLVLNSDDPVSIVTDDGSSTSGTDDELTYSARNFNGYVVANWSVVPPEYASASTNVTATVNIYADGVLIGTDSVSFTSSAGRSATQNWTGIIYDETAEITVELDTITVGRAAVKYVNGETGRTIYLDSWDNDADVLNEGVIVATAGGVLDNNVLVTGGNNIEFAVDTDDTTTQLQYTLTGLAAGNVTSRANLVVGDADANINTARNAAAGDDFVTVTIYGLGSLGELYDITAAANIDDNNADNVTFGSLSDNVGAGDAGAALGIRVTNGTGLNEGDTFDVSNIEIGIWGKSGGFTDAYSYRVTIEDIGSVVMNAGSWAHLDADRITVTDDIEITADMISVEVVEEKMAVESARWTTDTLVITFTEDFESALRGTLSWNASDYTFTTDADGTGSTPQFYSFEVTGTDEITITFSGEQLQQGDVITLDNSGSAGLDKIYGPAGSGNNDCDLTVNYILTLGSGNSVDLSE